jgi:hypothetical protein
MLEIKSPIQKKIYTERARDSRFNLGGHSRPGRSRRDSVPSQARVVTTQFESGSR